MKKETKEKESKEKLSRAIAGLDSIINNTQGKKKMKSAVTDVISMLNDEDSSIPVRAANAVSSLEDLTQMSSLEPYQRAAIWQAVSNLESIRE